MNMTDPNAHDLIQRLAQFAEDAANGYLMVEPSDDGVKAVVALAAEARAYLAQPKPEPKKPTIMEICALAEEIEEEELGEVDLVRRALARWGNHAPQLLPAKPGSADHIVNDDGIPWHQTTNALLWAQAFGALFPEMAPHEDLMLSWFANAIEAGSIHERWKLAAERTPIPLSERLPGAEETTDKNECWYWHPGEECWEMVPVVTGTWDEWSHWLPNHALPLPEAP